MCVRAGLRFKLASLLVACCGLSSSAFAQTTQRAGPIHAAAPQPSSFRARVGRQTERDGPPQQPALRFAPPPAGATGDKLVQLDPDEVAHRRQKLEQLLNRPATAINLASALRLASIQTPDILIAQNRVPVAVAERQLAASQFLPTIRGGMNYDSHSGALMQSSGNVLVINRSSLFVGAGANAIAAGTVGIPGVGWDLNLAESIFNYLATKQLVQRREFNSRAQQNEMLRRVADAYVELLRAEGRRAVALRTRDEARAVNVLTRGWAKAGAGREADVERTTGELVRREIALAQTEFDVVSTSARLEELLNLDPIVQLHPFEASVVPTPIVPEPIPVEELIAIALVNRPELAREQAAIQQAMLKLRNEKLLPFSPNVILMFSAGTFGGGSDITSGRRIPPVARNDIINNGMAFGAPVNQPRFDEFGTRVDMDSITYWELKNCGIGNIARVRSASSRLRQADLKRLETLNRVRREVAGAYVRTHARFAQIVASEQSVRSALLAYKEDEGRIRNNVGHPIELVTSLRLLAEARNEYINAIADYNQAHIDLYTALGQPPADVLARPVPQNASELPTNEAAPDCPRQDCPGQGNPGQDNPGQASPRLDRPRRAKPPALGQPGAVR